MRLFRIFLCLVMTFLIALPLSGCGEKYPTYEKGQYVDASGSVIKNENVTLDVIAESEYKKAFNSLSKSSERQHVIELYLKHHLPASGDDQDGRKNALINQLSALDVSNNMPSKLENGMNWADSLLAEASSAVALADFYAEMKDNPGFKQFVEKVDKVCKVADIALKFSKACILVADLVDNDVENKQEYCDDMIDALSFITSFVPVFDDYFTESLSIIKEGVQLVIKNYEEHETTLQVYEAEIKGSTLFSVITDKAVFECILDPDKWDDGLVLKRSYLFNTVPKGKPYEYLKEYILFRVSFELQNRQPEENTSIEDVTPKCTHVFFAGGEVIKEATCQEEGMLLQSCHHCDAIRESIIEKLDHDYDITVTEPTHDSFGCTTYTCKNCDHFEKVLIDPISLSPPRISGPTVWSAQGMMHYTHKRQYKFRVDDVSKDHISGYLEVYSVRSGVNVYTHKTNFHGVGKESEDGYVYSLTYDKSVRFGDLPSLTFSEMDVYYNSENDTFTFDYMYQVTMTRN